MAVGGGQQKWPLPRESVNDTLVTTLPGSTFLSSGSQVRVAAIDSHRRSAEPRRARAGHRRVALPDVG